MAASNVALADKRPIWAKELDEREFAFVSSYLGHFNATRAGLDAGMPKAGASVQAHLIKQRPHVRAAIEIALQDRLSTLKLNLAERLAAIAEANATDYFKVTESRTSSIIGKGKRARKVTTIEPMVRITPTANLTERQRAAIKGVKLRRGLFGSSVEVLLHDPIAAIDKLATLMGMQPQVDAKGGGAVTFIVEMPDGSAAKPIAQGPTIDHSAVQAEMAKDVEPDEDLPPGAKRKSKIVIDMP